MPTKVAIVKNLLAHHVVQQIFVICKSTIWIDIHHDVLGSCWKRLWRAEIWATTFGLGHYRIWSRPFFTNA